MKVFSCSLKKVEYSLLILIIIGLYGCDGGSSSYGGKGVAGRDIIIEDIQSEVDCSNQDIWRDSEYRNTEDIKDLINFGEAGEGVEEGVEIGFDTIDTDEIEYSDIIEDKPEDIPDLFIYNEQEDVETDVCIPNCINKECGDDGCGGCVENAQKVRYAVL